MLEFSTDHAQLDLPWVQSILARQSPDISVEGVIATISASSCLGVYLQGQQIGFVRAVSDFKEYAYIFDLYIAPRYRGWGIGTQLLSRLMGDDRFTGLTWLCKMSPEASFLPRLGFRAYDSYGLFAHSPNLV